MATWTRGKWLGKYSHPIRSIWEDMWFRHVKTGEMALVQPSKTTKITNPQNSRIEISSSPLLQLHQPHPIGYSHLFCWKFTGKKNQWFSCEDFLQHYEILPSWLVACFCFCLCLLVRNRYKYVNTNAYPNIYIYTYIHIYLHFFIFIHLQILTFLLTHQKNKTMTQPSSHRLFAQNTLRLHCPSGE